MLSPINFLGCLESFFSFIPHMLISVDYPTFSLFSYLSVLLIGGSSDRIPLLGSKITADSDCTHEIRRRLLLGRKAMTNLDNVLKSRTSTLWARVHIVKALVLPVAMYSCESWTVKKAEC